MHRQCDSGQRFGPWPDSAQCGARRAAASATRSRVAGSWARGERGKSVGQGRTYTSEKSNPKTFEVVPGKYKVKVKAVRLEGNPRKEVELTVEYFELGGGALLDFALEPQDGE